MLQLWQLKHVFGAYTNDKQIMVKQYQLNVTQASIQLRFSVKLPMLFFSKYVMVFVKEFIREIKQIVHGKSLSIFRLGRMCQYYMFITLFVNRKLEAPE